MRDSLKTCLAVIGFNEFSYVLGNNPREKVKTKGYCDDVKDRVHKIFQNREIYKSLYEACIICLVQPFTSTLK